MRNITIAYYNDVVLWLNVSKLKHNLFLCTKPRLSKALGFEIEVYLAYAEALNECGRTSEAYQYINAVRARVGLPGLVLKGKLDEKTEFREAVLRERACEFVWEENRFFDLIRWKRESDFTKHLHGINVYRHKTTKEYKFDFPQLPERAWQKPGGFSAKWYLSAFPDKEVNKGYGLVQNPGW